LKKSQEKVSRSISIAKLYQTKTTDLGAKIQLKIKI